MYRAKSFLAGDETSRRLGPEEDVLDHGRRSVELAPRMLESLVTWDVFGHAQCEKDRMNSACRFRGAGSY